MSDDEDDVPADAAPPQEPEPKPPASDAPKKEQKISLLDMIVYVEDEIGDVDIWERVLHSEGEPLYSGMERRRAIMRRVLATLELVKMHEAEFRALVIKARRAAAAVATQRSTARSSAKSTSANAPSDSTEP